jgi:hypothetical protein
MGAEIFRESDQMRFFSIAAFEAIGARIQRDGNVTQGAFLLKFEPGTATVRRRHRPQRPSKGLEPIGNFLIRRFKPPRATALVFKLLQQPVPLSHQHPDLLF